MCGCVCLCLRLCVSVCECVCGAQFMVTFIQFKVSFSNTSVVDLYCLHNKYVSTLTLY